MGSFAPGSVVGGDYEIIRPLSAGGMGEVYVARQRSTGRDRALKVMLGEHIKNEALKARFEQEARVGSQIDSEHIVEVVGAGIDGVSGTPWLAMELLEGEDLDAYLTRSGALDARQALELFEQIAHGVGAAHDKMIVHRDLKPENLFLARSRRAGQSYTVKVLDFGIAKMLGQSRTAATGAMGTPLWMSPEQTQPNARIAPSADVWALGLIAFRALSGRDFWRSAADQDRSTAMLLREILMEPIPPASQRAHELGARPLPPGFDAWFARCVHREPSARFRDARETFRELQVVLNGGATYLSPGPYSGSLATPIGAPAWPQPGVQSQSFAPMPTPVTYASTGPSGFTGQTMAPQLNGPYGAPPAAPVPAKKTSGAVYALIATGAVAVVGIGGAVAYVATRDTPRPNTLKEEAAETPHTRKTAHPDVTSATPPSTATAPPVPMNPFLPGQVWKGSYICGQGPTDLTLRIQSTDALGVEVVFDFSHGPTGAYGAYKMSGKYLPSTHGLKLTAGAWIRRPPNYVPVDMSGTVDTGRGLYTGKILESGCSDFEVRLTQ